MLIKGPLPCFASGIQQNNRTQHIGADKFQWIADGSIDMRFRSKMNNAVRLIFLKQLINPFFIGNVLQILQIAGIGQFIKIDNTILRVFL